MPLTLRLTAPSLTPHDARQSSTQFSRRSSRRSVPVDSAADFTDRTGDSGTAARPVSRELPDKQGVLLDSTAARHGIVVYGQDFVLCRHAHGGPGLVRRQGTQMRPYRGAGPSGNLGLALRNMQQQTGIVPVGSGFCVADGSIVIDTHAMEIPGAAAGSACLGIVPYGYPNTVENMSSAGCSEEDENVIETTSNNPRRTVKVKFTCNLCGGKTISPVNPHAWTSGSVFAHCAHCRVTHKLTDNLKLFFEVKGPVYGKPSSRVRMPNWLPQNPLERLPSGRVGGVDILDEFYK